MKVNAKFKMKNEEGKRDAFTSRLQKPVGKPGYHHLGAVVALCLLVFLTATQELPKVSNVSVLGAAVEETAVHSTVAPPPPNANDATVCHSVSRVTGTPFCLGAFIVNENAAD